MTLRARVTDAEGNGVAGVSVGFTRNDGWSIKGVITDSDGVAAMPVYVCQSELGDETGKIYTWTARMTSTTASDGTVYVPSSATTTVSLTQPKVYVANGRVIDKVRNVGVGGATVTVAAPGGARTGTTDANGNYSITIPVTGSEIPEGMDGTVTKTGFSEAGFVVASFTTGPVGPWQTIQISPMPATVVGRVMDAGTGEGEGGLLDGATVHVTQPFDKLIFTQGGKFTLVDVYVGDTLTMTADAINHKAYTKSGVITMENPSITFRLPTGKGDASGGLEETEATQEEMDEGLPVHHSLMIWASPADPGPFQRVTVSAQIFPPHAGVLVEISMQGTDGYTTSTTTMTDAMGKVYLGIPGAEPGVVDDVVARIIGENVRVVKELKYRFD